MRPRSLLPNPMALPWAPRRPGRTARRWAPVGLLGLLFAFYLIGLPDAFVHNDEAHGAVVLIADLLGTLQAVARDSHPPLYYLGLWLWLRLAPHPFALKFVSPFFALLALAFTHRLVREAAGARAALLAMLLLGLNPLFFAMATLGRMYAMAIAASALGAWLARRGQDGAWVVSAWGLTLTHFYGLWFVPAQRLLAPGRRSLRREGALLLLALLPVAGWLLYALSPTLAHTVRTLSRIPVRPTLPEVLANLMAALGLGIGVDGRLAPVGIAVSGLGLLAAVRRRTGRLWGAMALPILAGLGLALRFPFYAARYFAPVLPLYAWGLATGWDRRWRVPLTVLTVGAGLYGIGRLEGVYRNAPIYVEAQRELYSMLRWTAHPSDRFAFHGYWNQAEMALFYPETRGRLMAMEAVDPSALRAGGRMWLIGVTFFQDLYRPVAAALERQGPFDVHAWYPMAEVFRFVPWPAQATWQPVQAIFGGAIMLEALALPDRATPARGSVRIGLRWRALRPVSTSYVVFAHLWDAEGHYRAGTDREPAPTTDRWRPGEVYTQTLAIAVPSFLPPGAYTLAIGLYERRPEGWRRLLTAAGADALQLGAVAVAPGADPAPARGAIRPGIEWVAAEMWRTEVDGQPRWHVYLVWKSAGGTGGHRLRLRGEDGREWDLQPPEGWAATEERPGGVFVEVWTRTGDLSPGWYRVVWQDAQGEVALRARWVPPPGWRWNYDWVFLNQVPW